MKITKIRLQIQQLKEKYRELECLFENSVESERKDIIIQLQDYKNKIEELIRTVN